MTLCPQLRRLSAEHARWAENFAGWEGTAEEDRCSRLLALWQLEILPHCRAEEDVLLPELTRRLSETDAVIVFTLSDHVTLRRLARELEEANDSQRPAARGALERKLLEHTEFEERTLFPAIQEALGCDRIARLGPELAAASRRSPSRSSPAPRNLHDAKD